MLRCSAPAGETVNLPEGADVAITIHRIPSRADVEASRRSAGSWKGKVDAEALIRNIYTDRLIATRPTPEL
jgi:hypothetical protein